MRSLVRAKTEHPPCGQWGDSAFFSLQGEEQLVTPFQSHMVLGMNSLSSCQNSGQLVSHPGPCSLQVLIRASTASPIHLWMVLYKILTLPHLSLGMIIVWRRASHINIKSLTNSGEESHCAHRSQTPNFHRRMPCSIVPKDLSDLRGAETAALPLSK